ncbi:pullulanase-type alpha-1,6-glucosidase [Ornithinimicrobium cerasi]|uniref:pullulanase-type alpha-1,6-glucosidase n=1 Tax=Ornithinimicrobium cerasi TaxID=2248773 RepID=UPI000EFFCCB4|nr:pullulanase-type alpha-1,6-glucosidase [Ornithinimicrobium cerasi]
MRHVDLRAARAHWLTRDLLALPATAVPQGFEVDELTWTLGVAPEGGLDPAAAGEVDALPLALADGALPHPVADRHPHLAACHPLHLAEADVPRVAELLTGQVALLGRDALGEVVVATSLQVPGVLDDLYAAAASARPLGASWSPGPDGERVPTVTVWAPTAQRVSLLLWDGVPEEGSRRAWAPAGTPRSLPMTRHDDGCWSVTGSRAWTDRCYQLELLHVIPRTGRRSTVRSTDPWSVALTVDSTHSVLVDLEDARWSPAVWRDTPAPAPVRAVDQSIYEAHVRDLTRDDPSCPEPLRGSYLGLSADGAARRHLAALAGAGLTTVHLLPVFDLTSVEEDPALQEEADPAVLARLSSQDPAGMQQQAMVRAHATRDAFNWGYDPWHFMAPEGSYATDAGAAHGGRRVEQCRMLVGELHRLGLRVVLDQVYNHTTDSGLHRSSVLDRVVPGYYHRLDGEGRVETSTCCQNLATEHALAHRLMVESCVLWVRHYRVDGFRFDLMGHHGVADLEAVRSALDALTPEVHGVDGRAVTLYGEGWDFGEVAGNARFVQAVQGQLGGTGIGTFNDRLRDAVRGGSVHDEDPRTGLGFATGGASARHTDQLQVGLAGGLRDIAFRSQETGRPVTGATVSYGGSPTGYADEPDEVVNYVDAHDNETLWDTLLLKLPQDTPMAERLRRNTLALATVTLSQGISFWHAGAEILRSKSLDRNSHASGDWFNHLDYTLQDNGFGRGLPPEPDNGPRWSLMAPLLADPALRPSNADMAHARDCALDLLRLRRDLPLLRLGSRQRILRQLSFPVSGTEHGRPDVVVMLVDDTGPEVVDDRRSGLLLVLNGSRLPVAQTVPGLSGQAWALAQAQREGADEVVRATAWDEAAGTVRVPALTAAVLERLR